MSCSWIGSKDTTEFRWLRADHPQGQFEVFLPREKKHRYYVDHRENLFYIRTNKPGRNFAIMTAPESDPAPKNWKVFIAQQDDVLIEGIDLFQDFAVCVERVAGGGSSASIRLPKRQVDGNSLPRAGIRGVARRHAGVHFEDLPL